jgi:hypothetical protein
MSSSDQEETYEPYEEDQPYVEDIRVRLGKLESMIAFAIHVLTSCEAQKKWMKLTGPLSMTCGYTAPGIAVLLQFFGHYGIPYMNTLDQVLKNLNWSNEQFMFIVNETIGNLLDLHPECPVTAVPYGIRGLIARDHAVQMPIQGGCAAVQMPIQGGCAAVQPITQIVTPGGANLSDGPNIISFAYRVPECYTFHHAVIYKISEANICYVIDSWVGTKGPASWRPITSRSFTEIDLYGKIDELNSDVITEARTNEILITYFGAHIETIGEILKMSGRIMVHTISPAYIQHVYTQCFHNAITGQKSSFGGKKRNKSKSKSKSKSKNKSRKRSKKYSRRSNRKHGIYRRTHLKYNRV